MEGTLSPLGLGRARVRVRVGVRGVGLGEGMARRDSIGDGPSGAGWEGGGGTL